MIHNEDVLQELFDFLVEDSLKKENLHYNLEVDYNYLPFEELEQNRHHN